MSQPAVLLTQEPAPQSIPVSELPMKVYEPALNTGPDSSSGLATAGFRTAKFLPEEWHQNNYIRYHEAFADRDHSERCRHESQNLANYTAELAQRTQEDSTAKVGQRLQDIHFWKSELQREIEDLVAETDQLAAQKLRLERAIDATEIPYSIATDNLQCRERRQHPDLVRDQVEVELLKETELIRNIQELLKRTVKQAINQMQLNRDHKQVCEMDWSDKVETYNIDEKCGRYTNQSTNIQFHPSSSKFEDRIVVDPYTIDEQLLFVCLFVCSTIFHIRFEQTLQEIGHQEHNIEALKQAIKDKETPLKVAQTRLYDRSFRPNVDLCRDTAQFRLISEVEELTESIDSLKKKLLEAEQSLRNLEDSRMNLEKEIAVKTNSLFIDRQKCMTHRTRYPTILKLAGYQ
ncbi:PREDICTED: tektin-4 [Thamnophis sirtalis]|uniref:Tektin n=1 Tax=Thamnophis sirtalis TaxID=35019 RepID=A0A6I9Z1I5_9SAUR|nr:PREDICTED: tektin-4 [Thamnophis sirtalis]